MDNTISGSAQLKSDVGALRTANVNAAASGGANFQATADLSLGLDVGNLEVGSNKGRSIGVSTRFQAGNIVLSGGLPSLTLAPSLNLGFGGGSRGSGSCGGGKPGKGGRHSSAGESDSGSAGGAPSGSSTTAGASTVSGGYSSRYDNSAYRKRPYADISNGRTSADISYSKRSKRISVHGRHSASYSGGLGGKGAYSGRNLYGRQPSSYSQSIGGFDGDGLQSHNPVHDGSNSAHNEQFSARPYTRTGSAGLRHRATTANRVQNLTPLHSPKVDYGIASDSSLSMTANSHTRSGFGSTHRRYSSTEKTGTETKQSYGERLAGMLHQTVLTLTPNGAETDRNKDKKDTTVSKGREEAKRELSQELSKMREKLDEEDRATSTSTTGDISKCSGNGKDGIEADSENKKKGNAMAPKEKPFGSKKNIHTLGCFKNESTREVMKIGGNVHGFDA